MGHFGAIFGHFWPFLAILGPIKKLSQTSHMTTQLTQEGQNSDGDSFGSHIEAVDDIEAISGTFLQLWGHFGVIWCHSRPQNDLNVLKLSLKTIIICILLHLRSF